MATLADPRQRTVAAIYAAYEAHADDGFRPHLGASLIGHHCRRYLWLTFRWASKARFSGRMLRLFERGQREEAVFVANLRAAGVEVWEVDENGRQYSVSTLGGHFSGSMDGVGRGFEEAPQTPHVCEFKTHNAKSFAQLVKEGVQKAKPQHYAQMQVYMGLGGFTRAFYLAVNKDTDELYSERVEFDAAAFKGLVDKAEGIIFAPEPPSRISQDPAWYQCRMCDMRDLCHGRAVPEVNCRTCAHATPQRDGTWLCERHNGVLSTDEQKQGCQAHRFIPRLLENLGTVTDASQEENWITYLRPDGTKFSNGGRLEDMSSAEIKDMA